MALCLLVASKTLGRQSAISPVLDCSGVTIVGTFQQNVMVNTAYFKVPYSGGAGAAYSGEEIASAGVTGLSARLSAGTFSTESCQLVYNITGTPTGYGTAIFTIAPAGSPCTISVSVAIGYPIGTVHCSGSPTVIVPITNPFTGKIWMDRNLGASQVAASSTDSDSYGDLYQWGRGADGHQCRTSSTTSTLSSTDQPGGGDFIIGAEDWRSTSNDNLWQGISGVNNPCPTGYRIPTTAEWNDERASWGQANSAGAFNSIYMTLAGNREYSNGALNNLGSVGFYWTSSISGPNSGNVGLSSGGVGVGSISRAYGFSVRCIKN